MKDQTKNAQQSPVYICHQKDEYNGRIVGEWFTLVGIKYHQGLALKKLGWTWIKGPDGGAWSTQNPAMVQDAISRGMPVHKTGNGWELERIAP
jgi:hypothetical protein